MKNYFDVQGKFAIVTGASSGLGRQFALCLAEQGAHVAIVARRVEKLEQTKKDIEKFGVRSIAVSCDVTKPEQVREAVTKIHDEFGRIDILVNNAGLGRTAPAIDFSDEEWNLMIDTNLNGVFYFAREVGKFMVEQKYGKVINLGSIHSTVSMYNNSPLTAYAATKGGVLMLTKSLATEWAKLGITVNAIGPSYFPSEMTAAIFESEMGDVIRSLAPMGRAGSEGELNGALLYFASDASEFCTGQLLQVDGGWTAV